MDTKKLKFFAERLRAFLEHRNIHLKHGQALDLIAAIPGLRNWSEVNAFPLRVTDTQWDERSANRLAQRIAKLHSVTLSPDELLLELQTIDVNPLKIWPNGPVPGIYVTTSQKALDAAIAKYEVATDGALLYAESAGLSSDAAIDLGDYGLFSRGMDRLPSGTLVIVGSLPLTQESWGDNKDRLNAAANLAHSSSLRIAVLVETPLPENLHSDIDLLLRPENENLDSEPVDVLGVITETGDLQVMPPYIWNRLGPKETQPFSTDQRLPKELEDVLKQAVAQSPYGIIILGTTSDKTSPKARLEAVLPLTEHAGPAVRIQPTFRHGYGRDDTPLSTHFAGLPVLPSIESAYAHGYRRMVIESPYHGADKAISQYAQDVCFLIPSYSPEVGGALMRSMSVQFDESKAVELVTAILCFTNIQTQSGVLTICDAFIGGVSQATPDDDIGSSTEYIEANRVLRWQDQLDILMNAGSVTDEQVKKAFGNNNVEDYLAARTAAQAL